MTIISDLDGTLLSNSGVVPDELTALLSLAQDLDVRLVLATSRPLSDVVRIAGRLRKSLYAIVNDGSETAELLPNGARRYVRSLSLPPDAAVEILTLLQTHPELPLLVFFNQDSNFYGGVVGSPNASEALSLLAAVTPDRTYRCSLTKDELIKDCQRAINSIRAISSFVKTSEVFALRSPMTPRTAGARLLDYEDTRVSGRHWLEIVPESVGKHLALRELVATGVLDRPLVGFGNGMNDIAFLRECDRSFCPNDAHYAVRSIVAHTAPSAGGGDFCAWVMRLLKEGGLV